MEDGTIDRDFMNGGGGGSTIYWSQKSEWTTSRISSREARASIFWLSKKKRSRVNRAKKKKIPEKVSIVVTWGGSLGKWERRWRQNIPIFWVGKLSYSVILYYKSFIISFDI